MRLPWFVLVGSYLLISLSGYAQPDTAVTRTPVNFPGLYREQAYKFLIGANLQQAQNQAGEEYSRKYLEFGFHKTTTATYGPHPAAAITHGLSFEVAPEKNPVWGFKYGAWGVFSLFVIGINGIYYTNFDRGNFKIRPELGFGAHPFKLTFGYNVPTIANARFTELKRANLQITLNILLKLKTIKREEW